MPASKSTSHDLSARDRTLLTWRNAAGFSSWAELGRAASLSRHRLLMLRHARLERLPVRTLLRACEALHISPLDYLKGVGAIAEPAEMLQPETSASNSIEQWQRATLERLEPLLRQYPTARYAAERRDVPAQHVLALLHSLEQLLIAWEVEPIGRIGETAAFDPSQHESLSEDAIAPGKTVTIRYIGYRYRGTIWRKAQVRLLPSET